MADTIKSNHQQQQQLLQQPSLQGFAPREGQASGPGLSSISETEHPSIDTEMTGMSSMSPSSSSSATSTVKGQSSAANVNGNAVDGQGQRQGETTSQVNGGNAPSDKQNAPQEAQPQTQQQQQPQQQQQRQQQPLPSQPSTNEPQPQASKPSKPPTTKGVVTGANNTTNPQGKPDKPRPHVCTTCARSFARLEHLKRHERSHTKEKPFECPECSRCFARRDLLLRHQQKLHMGSAPASRARGRRESASAINPNGGAGTGNGGASMPGVGPAGGGPVGRGRKNSLLNGSSSARPRANTISHVDARAIEMMTAASAAASNGGARGRANPSASARARQSSLSQVHNGPGASYVDQLPLPSSHAPPHHKVSHHASLSSLGGMPNGLFIPQRLEVTPEHVQVPNIPPQQQQQQPHQQQQQNDARFQGLAKIDTTNLPMDMHMHGLRTAPILNDGGSNGGANIGGDATFNPQSAMFEFQTNRFMGNGNGTTINPAQLFFNSGNSPSSLFPASDSSKQMNGPGFGGGFQAQSAPTSTSIFSAMFDQHPNQQQSNHNPNQEFHNHLPFDPMAIDFSHDDSMGMTASTTAAGTASSFDIFATSGAPTSQPHAADFNQSLEGAHGMFFGSSTTLPSSAPDGSSPSVFSSNSQSGVSDSLIDVSTHTQTTIGTARSSASGCNGGLGQINGKATTTSAGWGGNGNMLVSSQMPPFGIDFSSPFGQQPRPQQQQQQQQQPHQQQQTDFVSPKTLFEQNGGNGQMEISTSFRTAGMVELDMPMGTQGQMFPPPMMADIDLNSLANDINVFPALNGTENNETMPDMLNDMTRPTLLSTLQQQNAGGNGQTDRRFSQASLSGVSALGSLSPSNIFRTPTPANPLPSRTDLNRYIMAYVRYFHPHLPFLHIPTLNFESPEYTTDPRMNMEPHHQQTGSTPTVTGGGACLMLSMAAIGALYEFDTVVSKELFESAKRMIHSYLEQRRKADMTAAFHRSSSSLGMRGDGADELKNNGAGAETSPSAANGTSITTQNTPLWLVQAMLLNVIYGHNCGDKTSAETAATHCAALVSLARAADLTSAVSPEKLSDEQIGMFPGNGNDSMGMGMGFACTGNAEDLSQDKMEWLRWKTAEERKRTLFAVFTLSSLLLSAYNHSPALMNSEIVLDMPCDEQLWAAGSPQEWMPLRSIIDTKEQEIPFPTALTTLLTTNQRERQKRQQSSSSSSSSQSLPTASSSSTPSNPGQASAQQTETEYPDVTANLKPSTFGCLILIHALHNYIWETRQRHIGRPWTTQETEAMHTHIEPALRAWQCAWQRNPHHSLERPNPFGLGPLSADSIPLLDLAYVRLFVNLARSKEAFWQRDWERMAEELARGSDLVQPGDEMVATADVKIESTRSPVASLPHVRRPSMLMDYGLGELNLGGGGAAGNGANGVVTGEAAMFGAGANKSPNAAHPSCQIKATGRERHLRQAAFYAADSLFMSDKLGNTYAEFSSRELPLQSAMCAFDCAQVLAEWVTTVQERVGAYVGILGQDAVDFTQVPAVMFLEDEDFKLLMKIDEILCSVERKMATLNTCDPGTEAWKLPPSLVPGGYGIKILFSTAYLLDRAAVWPVTKLMVKALEVQALRARERAQASVAGGFAAYLPSSGTGIGW